MLTYFGFMHGEAVGIGGGFGVTPAVALAYAVMAAGLFALGKTGGSVTYSSHHGDACRTCGVSGLLRPLDRRLVAGEG